MSLSFTNATASINATYGIIREGRMTFGGIAFNYTADTPVLWNELSASIESDSNVGDVTYTNNGDDADFLVLRNTAVADTSAITITQAGSTFSNAVAFNGYSAGSGLTSNSPSFATQIIIRKNNASGQVYEAEGNSGNTSDYVFFQFRSGGSTTTVSSGYTTNPVLIDVTDFGTDATLWDHVVSAIGDHGATAVSCTRSGGNFTVTSDTVGLGKTYFITESDPGNHIDSIVNTGGQLPSGSSVGDRITIDGELFLLAASTNRSIQRIGVLGTTNSAVWDELKLQIDASSSFTVTSTSSVGNIATFNLQADTTGTAENGVFSTAGSVSDSINITTNSEGGSNETGANESHYISWYAIAQNAYGFVLKVDKDNTHTGGQNFSASVASNGFTTIYVDSTRNSNADWWQAIHDSIEAEGFDVSYSTSATSASFVVTNFITGAAGNGGGSGNGVTSGATFQKLAPAKFSGGSDASGAANGDTITIHGQTITITHGTQDLPNLIVDASGSTLTDDQYWEALRTCINANVDDVTCVTGSGNPRIFNVTTTATGSSANANISAETGDTFVITDSGANGTDETGVENGDAITIDGSTFTINTSSGLGTGSTTDFHNALTKSIKDNTDFDTITVNDLGNGYHQFNLTSSVTGTAKNVSFTQNSNGSRATFQNLVGAQGGTSPIGIQDLDHIKIRDEQNSRDRFFAVDLNGDESDNTPTNYIYIDISGYSGTDAQKSTQFWNALSAAIKSNTAYDTINIATSSNTASFSLTSSITGAIYNGDILQVYTASNDGNDGFTILSNTQGGTDQSGASIGDTLTIGSDTFTIVHSSTPTATQINASGVTDTEFFNAMTAAIKDQTDFDLVTYTTASATASFSLTASTGDPSSNYSYTDPFTGESFTTGSAFNLTISVNPTSNGTFQNPVGMQGGFDGTFRNVGFKEIIPQPRYMYPHVLPSPGSMRAPSAKSNLGLVNIEYKMRSNHFNLTRSLGYDTDGLYDNTSRWTCPDLSGLVPMDDSFNEWYERHRGQQKHHSLTPEYRISSHVKGMINTGMNEASYIKANYWLELTGVSLDHGLTVAKNHVNDPVGTRFFLLEYATTTEIKDIDKFIRENKPAPAEMKAFKITLSCEALKSFLPYEGFYPQTRTVQMCNAFANSYGSSIVSAEADPNDTVLQFPDNNPLAQTRPIYDAIMSPGLLYNTMKSGIAVDYPIINTKMCTASLCDPYGGINFMVKNEYFEDRLPFETLLSPESYLSKKSIVDVNPHPSSSFNLRAQVGYAADPNYKMMANNFFAEAMEFFLQDGRSSRLISLPETDPNFGIVPVLANGELPVYRGIFKVYKSKKQHPYVEFSGAADIIANSSNPSASFDRYYNRPPSGTNYFLEEYLGMSGSDLEYDVTDTNYPRPQMNTWAEIETMTMYSQPNAFGPPCAGGVAVELGAINKETGTYTLGEHNNTTYMMYDSTNGYNAPFTPPYYDGESWAIYTFTPQREGKHSLDEILQNLEVKFLRYELNHESGSYGDRGTFGPQGFSINDNAMHVDAPFNLNKLVISTGSAAPAATTGQVTNDIGTGITQTFSARKHLAIESKFETPILNFAKYLNRNYNAEFEVETTTDDIYGSQISLSGSRSEPDTLSTVDGAFANLQQLTGVLNPVGMWHQYGDYPIDPNTGIFMQMIDIPVDYLENGSEMTIPNPKWIVVKPEVNSCDGFGIAGAYNRDTETTMVPYFERQENRRKPTYGEHICELGAIQVIDSETGIILDAELTEQELANTSGITIPEVGSSITNNAIENFKFFDVFRDRSIYNIEKLTTSASFVAADRYYNVHINGTQSNDYSVSSSGDFPGHWAASYYHYDRPNAYAPLLITTKNIASLSYDYGQFGNGFFEDFLKDFSIGVPYTEQSRDFTDADAVSCVDVSNSINSTVFAPKVLADLLEINNNQLTIANLSKIDLTPQSRVAYIDLLDNGRISTPTTLPKDAAQELTRANKKLSTKKGFRNLTLFNRKLFKLIPPNPTVRDTPSDCTGSYTYAEPMFVRGSIRYNPGAAVVGSDALYRGATVFPRLLQSAPQSDGNLGRNPSTIRWGQFMPNRQSRRFVKSLADLVGFSKEPIKMGVPAKSRTLWEAVVAMPYVMRQGVPEFLRIDRNDMIRQLESQGLIEIGSRELDTEEAEVTSDTEPVTQSTMQGADPTPGGGSGGGAITTLPDLSITPPPLSQEVLDQINKMTKYIFPPHLDFINYDVQPLAMYIFEFRKTINRQDLTDLWQGVRSENMKKVAFEQREISHFLTENSLLGALKQESPDMTALRDVKWRVFKVKYRGNFNYNNKMRRDMVELGFIPSDVQSQNEFEKLKFGYNWPYDFFSLAENVKIKVDVELQTFAQPEPEEEYDGLELVEPEFGVDQPDLSIGDFTQPESDETEQHFERTTEFFGTTEGIYDRFVPSNTPFDYDDDDDDDDDGGRGEPPEIEPPEDPTEPAQTQGDGEGPYGGQGTQGGDGVDDSQGSGGSNFNTTPTSY